ncbi:MAG: glycosyl transferase group 1 [Acidobacteria bacterium]|nr:glycosyl transferase group 1 [Acidobacteriota bacterium]
MAGMRIGFDARAAFLDPRRGFGRVARSLAEALLESCPGELVVFVPHGAAVPSRWYPLAAEIVQLRRPRRAAFLVDGPAWRWTLAGRRLDVIHLPTWGVPPGLPLPVVATFYDATPFRFPSPPGRWPRRRARMAIRSLGRATLVHAISDHARSELLATVPIDAAAVRAIWLAAGPPFAPADRPEPPEHLLFVGGADPHKNLEVVLAALALPGAESLPPLVLAGPGAIDRAVVEAVAQAGGGARFRCVPAPDDESLAALYRRAFAVLVPSRSEGFGLPVLEAMACATPVLAARAGALPEVAGDAAVLLDPDRPEAWRDALLELVRSPQRRVVLGQAGRERAAAFSWRRTAEALLELYREASHRRVAAR